jgi:Membrane-associated phospholipid phosphatase
MSKVTRLGDFGLIWNAISIVLIISKEYQSIGFKAVTALCLCILLGEGILKYTIKRVRPFIINTDLKILINKPRSYSFPSGHTASSVAVASILAIYFSQIAIVVFLLAFLISFSRVYLCVHYPSDVIIGAILGVICANISLIICR